MSFKKHYIKFEGLYTTFGPIESNFFGEAKYTFGEDTNAHLQLEANPHVVGPLSSVPVKVEPFKATESFSSLMVTIAAKDELINLFCRKQQISDGELDDPITYTLLGTTETFTNITISTNASLAVDDIIFIGADTYRIDGVSGSDYDLEALTANENHLTGDPVYTQAPPYFDGRKVELVALYSTDTDPGAGEGGDIPYYEEQTKWVGRIDGEITFDGGNITIPCRSIFGGLDDVTVNRQAARFRTQNTDGYSVNNAGLNRENLDFGEFSNVKKYASGSEPSNDAIWIRIEDTLYGVLYDFSEDSYQVQQIPALGSPPLEDREDSDGVENPLDNLLATELFLVSKLIDDQQGIFGFDASSTSNLANVSYDNAALYPYHPAAIIAAFLKSRQDGTSDPDDFDVLEGNWAFDLNFVLSDNFVSDVQAIIDAHPEYQVDHMLLGWDGGPVEIMRELRKLARAYGLFFGTDSEGFLTLKSSELTNIEDADTAISTNTLDRTLLQSDIVQTSGTSDVTDVINATIGKLPWQEGRSVRVTAEDRQPTRQARFLRKKDFQLDIPYISPENIGSSVARLVSSSLLQHYALPRLTIEVADQFDTINGDLDYGIGTVVALSDLSLKRGILLDETGNFVTEITNADNFFGQIIHNEYIPARGTYKLTIQFTFADPPKFRAPAGIVVSTGTSPFTIELGDDFGTLDGKDVTEFNKLDQIQVYNVDGTQKDATLFTITEIPETDGANVLTVNTDASGIAASGDIIRLANIDSDGDNDGYDNDSLLTNFDRKYVFMSGTDRTLGDADLDGDIYG